MTWTDELTASEKAALLRADSRRQYARARYNGLRITLKGRAEGRPRNDPADASSAWREWSDRLTPREATSLATADDHRMAAREAYNTLRAQLKSRAEARIRRRALKAQGVTRSLRWVSFETREPTQAERESGRLIGYVPIRDAKGEIVSDWFGKMFFHEADRVWMAEIYSNKRRTVRPGHFDMQAIEPTHWALVPALPG